MPDTMPQTEAWERQAGEPNRWFARFERYRLAGPSRSLLGTVHAELAEKGDKRQTKVPGAWSRAAADWRWRQRAEAWDEQQRQLARAGHAQAVADMNQRHIQEAQALQSKAIQRLKALALDDLSATEVLRYLVEASKLERTARGEPESIAERRLTGKGGGAIAFSLEDAVLADKELETWKHDRVQPAGGGTLPQGDPQVS
jgi:hypothetical protein